ncbi:hypothetical protein MTR_7g070790 [Medicago truncatula]|uniref:Uncharacterized protein n=1 Tax=Medicago truncatula TaxID=3880 RepID=G7KU75_MEDTR|nr:hypothetical protein MTR_7g070790 [Medicago truncatula]
MSPTHLSWPSGIGLGPENVLLFEISGSILPTANLATTTTIPIAKSTFTTTTPSIHIDKPPNNRVVEPDEKVLIEPNH